MKLTFDLLLCDLWITASGVQVVASSCEDSASEDGDSAVGHGCLELGDVILRAGEDVNG